MWNARGLGAILYLVVFGSWVGFSAYIWLLNHVPTQKVATYAYVNPVVAVFLGWLILNEPLTWLSILAMFVILAGVAMVQTSGWRKSTVSAPAEEEKKAA